MEINLPAIPAGVLTLLSFFAPYAVAILNHPSWPSRYKKLAALIVSVVLTLLVLGFYFVMTGDVIPDWPVMILLAPS